MPGISLVYVDDDALGILQRWGAVTPEMVAKGAVRRRPDGRYEVPVSREARAVWDKEVVRCGITHSDVIRVVDHLRQEKA